MRRSNIHTHHTSRLLDCSTTTCCCLGLLFLKAYQADDLLGSRVHTTDDHAIKYRSTEHYILRGGTCRVNLCTHEVER